MRRSKPPPETVVCTTCYRRRNVEDDMPWELVDWGSPGNATWFCDFDCMLRAIEMGLL